MKVKVLFMIFTLLPLWAVAQTLEIKADKKGKLGYFDSDGKKVISCQYEEAEPFEYGVAKVRKNGKYGLINEKGKAIGGLDYTVMEEYANTNYYLVCEGGSEAGPKDKIATRTGVPVMTFKGSMSYPIKGGKWGIIDAKGKVLIKPEYDEVSNPINGVIYVNKGGKLGFFSEQMQLVLKPTYNFMGSFNAQGLCWVKNGAKVSNGVLKGGKMSVVDRAGKLIVPMKFENVCTFTPSDDSAYSSKRVASPLLAPFQAMPDSEEPYLWFATKGTSKVGVISSDGTVVVPEKKYDLVFLPTDGMMKFACVTGKKKATKTEWGYYNIESKTETKTDAEYIFYPFHEGISKAMRNDSCLYYFVDKEFHEITDRYTQAGDFVEGYCYVGRGGKYGALNHSGKEVIPLEYSNVNTVFSEGLLGVEKDGKWGFVTAENKVQIPLVYENVKLFKNGQVSVKMNGKWGAVDKQNNVVLPIEWKDFYTPEQIPSDYYWVQKEDDLHYYFDTKSQKILFPADGNGFNEVWLFRDKDYARVKSSCFYGAVYRDGSECVPIQFDALGDVEKAIFYLQKNNLTKFKEVDMRRFKIILRGSSNSHQLSDRIPAEDWDF